MKIMIVEDSLQTRELIKRLLYQRVMNIANIIECDDGAQAVHLYDETRPDWVLMDINIKTVDGLTATQDIIARHKKAKIIIVTMYNDPEYKEVAKKVGAYGYVLKENLSDIADTINSSNNKSEEPKS